APAPPSPPGRHRAPCAAAPPPPSPLPRLAARPQAAAAPRPGAWLGLAALAPARPAAACLAAVLVWHLGRGRDDQTAHPSPPAPLPAEPDAPPTLWTYQRALAESPEAATALLDKQAALSAASGPAPQPVRAFPLSDRDTLTLVGDL